LNEKIGAQFGNGNPLMVIDIHSEEAVMSLLEKLNLSSKSCKLPIIERIALVNAEKAKIKAITAITAITEGLGCAEDEYGDMLAHEIAEMVLVEIEKPVKPGSLHELHGGTAYWWRPFGSKEKLVEFLKPFRKGA
jgi:hypothetical protein